MAARLLFILTLLSIAGCGGGGVNVLPEPFTRERADGKIPVKTELIRAQVRAELAGMPEGEAEVARWQAIETDYHACRLIAKDKKTKAEEVFADCMAQRGYVYMYPIDAEQFHNDIAFEVEKEREEQEKIRQQKALDDALVAAVRNGYTEEEARLIAEGANPQVAENTRKRIVAERKAEEARRVAEKKRQEEQERARLQKELDDALVIILNAGKYADFTEIKIHIARGADINTKGKNGLTPLHLAAINGQTGFASLFIEYGADVDAKNNNGFTPLHVAVVNGHTETLLALIKHGADIDAKTNNGFTPLHVAAGNGHAETLLALVKHGADIDAKNNEGWTPLHYAAQDEHTEIADVLIKAGANINAKTNHDTTPLHLAAQDEHTEIADVLIKAGANINAKDDDGFTPLHVAAYYNHTEIALAFVNAGANLYARTNKGNTPFDIAIQKHGKNSKIARILL